MEYLYEKVSYLKGLADGLAIDESRSEGKLLLHIIDTLEEFADAIVDLKDEQDEMGEYVEAIDESLSDMEEEVYLDYDEDDYGDYDEDYDDEFDFEEE